jgi:hypothetical protein
VYLEGAEQNIGKGLLLFSGPDESLLAGWQSVLKKRLQN